jgi:hypothetical protein
MKSNETTKQANKLIFKLKYRVGVNGKKKCSIVRAVKWKRTRDNENAQFIHLIKIVRAVFEKNHSFCFNLFVNYSLFVTFFAKVRKTSV